MPKRESLNDINPAVLRYRGLEMESLFVMQKRNLEAFHKVASLAMDGVRAVADTQLALMQSNLKHVDRFASGEERAGMGSQEDFITQQTERMREIFDIVGRQAGELTQTACQCGCNAFDQMQRDLFDVADFMGSATEQTEKTT